MRRLQLPHRTGSHGEHLLQDEIVIITRATLVKVSTSSIVIVLDALLSLLADLGRPYKTVDAHPAHILLSELYILALAADCCSSHWDAVSATQSPPALDVRLRGARLPPPDPLDNALVHRIFDSVKLFLNPIPEGYIVPARTILDDRTMQHISALQAAQADSHSAQVTGRPDEDMDSAGLLDARAAEVEGDVQTIVEYVTASSWSSAFDYFRNVIYTIRTTVPSQPPAVPSPAASDDEKGALVILGLMSSFWVDRQKLSQVIQELCSSFLHFRKPFQNTVALVTPLLITRWVDRYPDEFVQLHATHQRADGGPDTLFDMTQTVGDGGKRRGLPYPLQTALLLLLPDVFEVASNLREAKGGSTTKKVAFLDSLRKALRNRNDQAAYCLVSLLRAARHFHAESDSALMSYAMDVQDEVRDAVFRRFSAGSDASFFEQDILTAAFVSLAHLHFDLGADSLAKSCLVPSAPIGFKIAVIQSCSYFARLEEPEKYQPLFTAASAFIQGQLKVSQAPGNRHLVEMHEFARLIFH